MSLINTRWSVNILRDCKIVIKKDVSDDKARERRPVRPNISEMLADISRGACLSVDNDLLYCAFDSAINFT